MKMFPPLRRALAEQHYETPTPIQSQTIPPAIEGHDILGCAQTGTGKTAAFALPILDYLGYEKPRAQSRRPTTLVLAPTRELAVQISASFRDYGKHVRFRQALIYGGVAQAGQVKAMRGGVDVLIATPGRLLDLMQQGHIDLDGVEIFVLDEADRMLDMGFLPDLKKIIAKLPRERQSLFFSATVPPKIRQLAKQLLVNPVQVNVTPKSTSVERIEQTVRMVDRGDKLTSLRDTLGGDDVDRAIVFTRTKHGANALAKKLERAGILATAIHGNKTQSARQKALDAFRKKRVTVLVATDVAARGIDIDGVTHVINYDMPVEPESYVHRIGRTGRAGADGIAISFCTADEREHLRAIERLIGQSVTVENPEFKQSFSDSPPAKKGNSSKPNRSRRPRAGGNKHRSNNGRSYQQGDPSRSWSRRGKKSSRGRTTQTRPATSSR